MKLHELRQELDTDARKRCEAQEETIKNLIGQNKQLAALLKDRDDSISGLQNRCFIFTRGILCGRCTMQYTCRKSKGLKAGEGGTDG